MRLCLLDPRTEVFHLRAFKPFVNTKAVPRLRRLVADMLQWRPGIDSRPVDVGFLLDKAALRQVFLEVIWSLPVTIIPPMLRTFFFDV